MAPSENIGRNHHETTEWLIEHIPSGLWSSLTFQKGNHSTVQVVTDSGHVVSMSLDSALTTLAYVSKNADYRVGEV